MPQYKCVQAPTAIKISTKQGVQKAMSQFTDLINSEAVDGWRFYSMENIVVVEKAGCLAGLFGASETNLEVNMLVFVKE